jgi:hypothetical protein
MSIKRMSAIWESSQHKGSVLLQLLAIADHAGDDGFAWPGIETLARKTRLTTRAILKNNDLLEASGELYIDHNRRRGNQYIVTVGLSDDELAASLKMHYDLTPDVICEKISHMRDCMQKSICEPQFISDVKSFHIRCEPQFISDVNPSSHESSLNINESSMNHHIDAEQKTPASPKAKAPKVSPPEPVKVYRQGMEKYPKRNTWNDIALTVIPHNGNMNLWREIVTAWKLHGWNPANIAGMLDCWRKGEIPKVGYTQKQASRARQPLTQQEAQALYDAQQREKASDEVNL